MIAPPSRKASEGRKVRAPQGTMLANGEGERSYGKCHRKENATSLESRLIGGLSALALAKAEAKLKRWCKRPPASQ